MSSAMNHVKRSHRSSYRARAFLGNRVSVITPSLRKQHSFNLMRLLRGRRKQPETAKGRMADIDGE